MNMKNKSLIFSDKVMELVEYNSYLHGNLAFILAVTAESMIHNEEDKEITKVAKELLELLKEEEKIMSDLALEEIGI